jgi:monofunctional biosynthetic peptidoglycan transglycosylase
MILRFLKSTLRWIAAAFFGTTILAVVAFRFLPVYVTPLMVMRSLQQLREGAMPRVSHHWVSLSDMSPDMSLAVMSSEDARFLDHHGFDLKAIQAATEHNLRHANRPRHGGSTISQQTAKNVFLWPSRTWLRKGLEAYFTLLIELTWGKERIMEVYLNSIEMGPGIYGTEAVARNVFHCHASELSREQCALIAATLPNPLRFSSAEPSAYVLSRRDHILREMKYMEKLKAKRQSRKATK